MALRAKVLQKKAEKFELKKLQDVEVTKEGVSALETMLHDIYANRRPKPTDYQARKDLIRVFNGIAKEIYGTSKNVPVVVEFGSFVMDLFSTTSDLDLSVNFSSSGVDFPREKKIQTLRKFAKKLYALQNMGHVSGVLPVTTAKVPILKCVDRGTGVECDISVENRDGISKSQIIWTISSIDERFKKLSFLMKTWATAHNINCSRDRTLNSLSIILLVAFHLQTRNPPILPSFSAIFKDSTDPAMVAKSISKFANYGKRNKESLAELFITLLLKLSSVEKLWAKGLCASTNTASWTSKTWNSKVANISVEDFSDTSQNVARAVGVAEVKQIYKCIDMSIRHIACFMGGQIGSELKDLLFGVDGIPTSSIPRNLNVIGPSFMRIPSSQGKPNKGMKVSGKRKKKGMQKGVPLNKKRTIHPQLGNGKQIQQAMPLAKRARTDEGWRGTGDGRCIAAADRGGWDEVRGGGWEENSAVGGGRWQVRGSGGGWGDWGGGGCGWGGGIQQQHGSWGSWGGGIQQQHSSWGGWERGGGDHPQQQQNSRSWPPPPPQQSSSWGGWERGGGDHPQQQQNSRSWPPPPPPQQQQSRGGWEDTQQREVGAWGWGGGTHQRPNLY